MKKTLIALAALGAMAGVAHAQSSVTLYGVADAYIGNNTTKTSSAGTETKVSQGVINGSGLSSSRWGLRGSEDLGGGMAAVFTLEGGFSIDTGALANNGGSSVATSNSILFGRTASVGLKGSFGEVRLGRQYTAYDAIHGLTNGNYDSNTFATASAVAATGMVDYSNRVNNAISYTSPDFSGFSGAVVYGFGEDKTSTTSASNSTSLHIKYANGPLLVGYGYQREKVAAGGTLFSPAANPTVAEAAAANRKYNLIGASYDFGVAKLLGSYTQAKDATFKDRDYQIGVNVPFGAAALSFGYTKSKSEAAGNNNKGRGLTLLGTYDLSKRTTLYAGAINTKIESVNATTVSRRQLYAAGVRHSF